MIKEVMTVGRWTDSAGNAVNVTESWIDKIVSSFSLKSKLNTQNRRVPLVPGHPKGDTPALGWVKRVWRNGKSMFAEFEDVIE